MSTERDTEQFNQQPTDQSNESIQPTDQSNEAIQPTDQASESQQGGEWSQQPSMSGEQPSGLEHDSDTLTEQKTDVDSHETTGESQSSQFLGQQGQDSGDYLRKEETDESSSNIEGSSETFGTNGE